MTAIPLRSLSSYSRFLAHLLDQPGIEGSTVTTWSDSPYTGIAEGEVVFANGLRLRMREEIDFDAGIITSYGYEVYRAKSAFIGTTTSRIPTTRPWPQPCHITNTYRPTSSIIGFLRLKLASTVQTYLCSFGKSQK